MGKHLHIINNWLYWIGVVGFSNHWLKSTYSISANANTLFYCFYTSPHPKCKIIKIFLLKFLPFSEQVCEFNSNAFFFNFLKITLYILQLQNSYFISWEWLMCSPKQQKEWPFQIINIFTSIVSLKII